MRGRAIMLGRTDLGFVQYKINKKNYTHKKRRLKTPFIYTYAN